MLDAIANSDEDGSCTGILIEFATSTVAREDPHLPDADRVLFRDIRLSLMQAQAICT